MNIENSNSPILLVEDNEDHVEAVKRAFKKTGLINTIHHCDNGQSALDFLHRKGEYSNLTNSERPGIILLDLNMPGMDGRAVLREIKQDKNIQDIPVVILTTSDDEKDVEKCYREGANTYIKKPVDTQTFLEAIQRLKDYWFSVAILPAKTEDFTI